MFDICPFINIPRRLKTEIPYNKGIRVKSKNL